MKAAVSYGPNEGIRVEDVKRLEITPRQVLVRIRTCGICSGDVRRLAGRIKAKKIPMILGHERAGTIAEVGSQITGFHQSDNVVMFATGCGECYYCSIGKDNVCDKIADGFGLGYSGAYAEYAVAYPKDLFVLPAFLLGQGPYWLLQLEQAFTQQGWHRCPRVTPQSSMGGDVLVLKPFNC